MTQVLKPVTELQPGDRVHLLAGRGTVLKIILPEPKEKHVSVLFQMAHRGRFSKVQLSFPVYTELNVEEK